MPKKNFIITHDLKVAEQLRKILNEVVSNNTNIFTFVNDTTVKFSNDIDMSKIRYSDKLFY